MQKVDESVFETFYIMQLVDRHYWFRGSMVINKKQSPSALAREARVARCQQRRNLLCMYLAELKDES